MNLHSVRDGIYDIPERLQLVIRAYYHHFHLRVRYHTSTGELQHPQPFTPSQPWNQWEESAIHNWIEEANRLTRRPGLQPLNPDMVEILP